MVAEASHSKMNAEAVKGRNASSTVTCAMVTGTWPSLRRWSWSERHVLDGQRVDRDAAADRADEIERAIEKLVGG
jgi:hypothetical protein